MGSLHGAARGIVAQGSEMHMQVVVGGLVVQVDPQLGARHTKTLPYGLLRGETESSALTKPWNGWEGASLDGRKGVEKGKRELGFLTARERGKFGRTELFPTLHFSLCGNRARPLAAPLLSLHDGMCHPPLSLSLSPLSLQLIGKVTGIRYQPV